MFRQSFFFRKSSYMDFLTRPKTQRSHHPISGVYISKIRLWDRFISQVNIRYAGEHAFLDYDHARFGVIEAEEHGEIVAEIARQQEMLAYELVAGLAHALPLVGIAQQVADAVGGPGRGMHEETRSDSRGPAR